MLNQIKSTIIYMKLISKTILLSGAFLAAMCFASCDNDVAYEDADTNNPSFVPNYTDSTVVAHPDSLVNTSWQRGTGIKRNVFGQEIEGYVESLNFERDSVVVKMSEPSTIEALGDGANAYTWTDDSNNEKTPKYEYTYSSVTGRVEIFKMVKNDKGAVSKSAIFTGIAVSGTLNRVATDVITLSHFGDVPSQTYLVRQ